MMADPPSSRSAPLPTGKGAGARGRVLALLSALALTIVAAPGATDAQQPAKVYRIGFLGSISPSAYAPFVEALRQGLRELGYVEGKNMLLRADQVIQ